MMLGMMDAMGVIDRIPTNAVYGGYPSSQWSSQTNQYSRALAKRGIYPGSSLLYKNPYMNNMYGSNPFNRSPWLQSPWSQSGQYGSPYTSPLWGSPDWGVIPARKYSAYGYPYYGQSRWSSFDLEGWVDEPWETSEWNPDAERSNKSVQAHASQQTRAPQQTQTPQQNVPLVQNFNFGVPENDQFNRGQNDRPGKSVKSRSPLSKLAQPRQPVRQSGRPPVVQQRSPSPLRKKTMQQPRGQQPRDKQPREQQSRRSQPRQKPCITEFCGLKKPNLNGLWVAQNGEMLGVNNQKFLWSDGTERYITGQIKIQNEYLLARVEGKEQLMRFKYKLAGDHLITMQPDGVIREFIRMSPEQYYSNVYGGY